jgi:nitrogen regulatory protein PII
MYMILFVLNDREKLDAVLDAWESAGIRGATVLDSFGMHRRKKKGHVAFRYVFEQPGMRMEIGQFSLVAAVQKEADVQTCLFATETVTGDLSLPDSGMFAAWPLATVKGAWGKEPAS